MKKFASDFILSTSIPRKKTMIAVTGRTKTDHPVRLMRVARMA